MTRRIAIAARYGVFLALTLAFSAFGDPARSQTVHFEAGLQNTGPLATEVTHFARPAAMPGNVYISVLVETKAGPVPLTLQLVSSNTILEVDRCDGPCRTSRWNYRPGHVEYEAALHYYLLAAMVRLELGPAALSAGPCVPFIDGGYAYYGAVPMFVKGLCARVAVETDPFEKFAKGWHKPTRIGLAVSVDWVPPQRVRWTVLSEKTGYKQNGQPFPDGVDPVQIFVVRAGFVVGLHSVASR